MPGARSGATRTLKPRDRSLLNLGMIACLGRMHEFEAHFRGALRNGLTPKELAAILRQVAIYCGFPAAVDCPPRGQAGAGGGGEEAPDNKGLNRRRQNHVTEIVAFWS